LIEIGKKKGINVTSLKLNGDIGCDGIHRIASLSQNSPTDCIRHLYLSNCNIGDTGAEKIANLICNASNCLLTLDISNNKITDIGITSIGVDGFQNN